MRRSRASVGALFGALFALSSGFAPARAEEPETAADESTCVTCHEVEPDVELAACVPEWRDSVHAENFVSCDACHGGDPRLEDADESMSEEAGFLELPSWSEMADHCGVCHEEIAEAWRAGRFGRAMDEQRVPTCADCHMQHGHEILEAVPDEIVTNLSCPACATVSDPEASLAALREVEALEHQLVREMDVVLAKGIDMTDFRLGLEQVHVAFARTVHEFDEESLSAAQALASTQYAGLSEQVAALGVEADGRRKLGLGLLGALALLFLALWMRSRELGN